MDTNQSPRTTDEYIARFPADVQVKLQAVRATIRDVVPSAQEAMKYGLPTFVLNGENLVHFGGFKTHIGFYPTPSGIEQFQGALSGYKGSKGAVQFPLTEPLPLDLIREITTFRMAEVEAKAAEGKQK